MATDGLGAGILGGFGSVFYGVSDFAGGLAARRGHPLAVTLLSGVSACVLLLVAMPFASGSPRAADWAWAVAAGGFGGIGAMLIYRVLAKGPVSVASPILGIVGLGLPSIVGLAIGERIQAIAAVGLLLTPIAILLLARDEAPVAGRGTHREVVFEAIVAGMVTGCFLTCYGRIGAGAGLVPLLLARLAGMSVLAGLLLGRRLPLLPPRPARPLSWAAGCADSVGNVLYVFAVQRGSLALMAALVSLAPATTVLLARAVLGERWSPWQRAGLLVALAAGTCIAMG